MSQVAKPNIDFYKSSVNILTVTFTGVDFSQFDSYKVVHYRDYSSTPVQELTFTRVDNVFTISPNASELAKFESGENALKIQFIDDSLDLPVIYAVPQINLSNAFAGSINNQTGTVAVSGTSVTFEVTSPRGIESIELTDTTGLVKTYTITFTDSTTFDYTVTDGEDGVDGIASPLTDDLNADGNKVVNLATPTADADASTKKYADDLYQDSQTLTWTF